MLLAYVRLPYIHSFCWRPAIAHSASLVGTGPWGHGHDDQPEAIIASAAELKVCPALNGQGNAWLDIDYGFGTLTPPPDLPFPGEAIPHLVDRGVDDRHRHGTLRQRAVHHAATSYGDQLANPRTVRATTGPASPRRTVRIHFLRQNDIDRSVLDVVDNLP